MKSMASPPDSSIPMKMSHGPELHIPAGIHAPHKSVVRRYPGREPHSLPLLDRDGKVKPDCILSVGKLRLGSLPVRLRYPPLQRMLDADGSGVLDAQACQEQRCVSGREASV